MTLIVGSYGNPHPKYADLLTLIVREKLRAARLVMREVALDDVTNMLERMTRFETADFEAITRFS